MGTARAGDLELEQDLAFERRELFVERIGWAAMALVIAGALTGLFGVGPLSLKTVAAGDLSVTYERFGRRGGSTSLTFEAGPGAAAGGELTLWLSATYIDGMQLDAITPEPGSVTLAGDRVEYSFKTSGVPGTLRINFDLTSDTLGPLAGQAGIAGGPAVELRQFFWP